MTRSRRRLGLLWLMLLLVSAGSGAETVANLPSQPATHVEDFAGILSPETAQSVENLLTQLNLRAHARIEVVTLHSMDPDKSGAQPSIEEFATALEDKWKVGEKGTDRGLLLIVSLNPRKYRIEVGYGLEGVLNDAKVGDIGRDMQPYLHTGNYNQAITLGVNELSQDIAADAGVALDTTATAQAPQRVDAEDQPQVHVSVVPTVLFGLLVVFVLGVLIRSGHAGWLFFILLNLLGGGRGGGGGDWGGGGGFGGGGGGDSGVGFGGGSGGGGASGDF